MFVRSNAAKGFAHDSPSPATVQRVELSLGIVLAALNNPAAAAEHFAQALRIHPDLASANYNLGLALRQQGKTNEAQGYFEKAERLKRGETSGNP